MFNNLVKLTLRHCILFLHVIGLCVTHPVPLQTCRGTSTPSLPPSALCTLGCLCPPMRPSTSMSHTVHSSHPDQPLRRWPWGGLWGPAAMRGGGLGALWPSGPAPGRGRGQQRCWAVPAPDSGGGCGSWIPTPVTEGGAEAVPPGVWDTARPTHQPHSSSNESPGSGSTRWPRAGRRLRWA